MATPRIRRPRRPKETTSPTTLPHDAPLICILQAPGTSCAWDTQVACTDSGLHSIVWSLDSLLCARKKDLFAFDALILPGGSVHGDHLAAGLLVAYELDHAIGPLLRQFVADGKMILGICNGFQIITRLGLIPGLTLVPNSARDFASGPVTVRTNKHSCARLTPFLPDHMTVPVSHREGRVIVRDPCVLDEFQANGQILLQYCTPTGHVSTHTAHTPNGSAAAIAGACNQAGTVIGMMPHPERNPYTTAWSAYGEGWGAYAQQSAHIPNPGLAIFDALKRSL